MFEISENVIDTGVLRDQVLAPESGAFVCFEGWVRNRNEGMAVQALEYSAYKPLAEKEGARILAEAREKFGIAHAVCRHRVGHLVIGEIAVWVGVSSGHRGDAFSACRYIIDEVKARVPIWKREHYVDGLDEWIACAACAATPVGHEGHRH
jgi:molybdopterin synthase catalytic subunit